MSDTSITYGGVTLYKVEGCPHNRWVTVPTNSLVVEETFPGSGRYHAGANLPLLGHVHTGVGETKNNAVEALKHLNVLIVATQLEQEAITAAMAAATTRLVVFDSIPGVPVDQVEYQLHIAQEELTEVRGNAMASGDDAADKAYEDEILARLERDDLLAWCCLQVTARWRHYSAQACLGAYSFAEGVGDPEQAAADEFAQLKQDAYDFLNAQVQAQLTSTLLGLYPMERT